VFECVPNVSEGRDPAVIDALTRAGGRPVLDVHVDPDHHRSVLTMGASSAGALVESMQSVALAVADRLDVSTHSGAHPRFGALDVVPFIALGDASPADAVDAAHRFARWAGEMLATPVFLYGGADPEGRSLPDVRRDAFTQRNPDLGPSGPNPRLGAIAVGVRAVMVAVNVELRDGDVALARSIAGSVRERDGGLPGVQALGFELASRGSAQVSMNLVDLEATGLEQTCTEVRRRAETAGAGVERIELVGLLPESELVRMSTAFREWARIDADQTIEARFAAGGSSNRG